MREVRVRGKKSFMVRWHAAGRLHRQFFSALKPALAVAAQRRGEALSVDQKFFLLPPVVREDLLAAGELARAAGADILPLVREALAAKGGAAVVPGLAAVIEEMVAAKVKAGRAALYVSSLRLIGHQFAAGREALPINKVSLVEVEKFLESKSLAYRATLRARLSALFRFARRRKYRLDNPCDDLEAVKVVRVPPVIFSPEQAAACVTFLNARRAGLAWFILTTFAGLRPEEALKCEVKRHFHLDAVPPFVEVTPDICKTGQWRMVYVLPAVAAALRRSLRGLRLPLPKQEKKRLLVALRGHLGLEKWPKDVTRHSASSYWLALVNDQRHVAEMLGHSERTARAIYKKPVSREAAERFFAAVELVK